jgi:predicted DNA-binding transcriptional regulator YafY
MPRSDRLSEIVLLLQRASEPMTVGAMAGDLGASRPTIAREVGTLIDQHVPIRGEVGGYVLDRGFDTLPLMLTLNQIEAVVLGAHWVKAHGDPALVRAATEVFGKIASTLPARLRGEVDDPVVGMPPARPGYQESAIDVGRLRTWSRQERKLVIGYIDKAGLASERTVWPFLVGYGATSRMLMAWCELRHDFRMFRTDRLTGVEFLDERYPGDRATLRRRWLTLMEERHG